MWGSWGIILSECKDVPEPFAKQIFQHLCDPLSSPALGLTAILLLCISWWPIRLNCHLLISFSSPFISFIHWVLLHCIHPFYSSGQWFPNALFNVGLVFSFSYKGHEFFILIKYAFTSSINWLIDRVSLCSPGWPSTFDPSAFAFQVLWEHLCITHLDFSLSLNFWDHSCEIFKSLSNIRYNKFFYVLL